MNDLNDLLFFIFIHVFSRGCVKLVLFYNSWCFYFERVLSVGEKDTVKPSVGQLLCFLVFYILACRFSIGTGSSSGDEDGMGRDGSVFGVGG